MAKLPNPPDPPPCHDCGGPATRRVELCVRPLKLEAADRGLWRWTTDYSGLRFEADLCNECAKSIRAYVRMEAKMTLERGEP